MQSLIDQLTPMQRALLYTALTSFKETAQRGLAVSLVSCPTNMLQQFYSDTEKECKAVSNILFADCFIDDLDYLDQYTKEKHSPLLNPTERKEVFG